MLALTEMKLKGNGKVSWCGVNDITTGVQERERAKEGVAQCGDSFGCVSSRILWIKFKFSRVEVCVVVGYGPNKGGGEERNRPWNDMDRTLDDVGNEYRFCILGYLNGCIGDRTRDG